MVNFITERVKTIILTVWKKINSKLLYKMIIIYSLLTVIPLVTVSTTFYLRSKSVIETKLIESKTQSLVETSDKIDGILRVYSDKIEDIGESLNVRSLLQNDSNPIKFPLEADYRKSLEGLLATTFLFELSANEAAKHYLDAFYILNEKGKVYASVGAQPLEFPLALKYMPYQSDDRAEWAFFIDQKRMICSRKIVDKTTGETLGYAAVMLKQNEVASLYSSYPQHTFFITNDRGVILSSDIPSRIGSHLDIDQNSGILINRRASNNPNIIYYNLVPKPTFYKEINDLGYFAGAITLLTLLIVLLLTITLLRRITHPLRKLTILMRKAEKEVFEPITDIKTYDEIGQLGNSFNSLISEIKDLIGQVYKAELFKKEAEIRAIKMHMNPHFLYNTLETIGILAKRKDEMAVVPDMIQKLSRILRFSISPGNDYIPLKTEIQFAEWYIQIHQYRYGKRLSNLIEVPDELMSVIVPKLILQSIVENAILHGINQIQRPGKIIIRAFELNYDLILEVEDNGHGFRKKENQLNGDAHGLGTGLAQVESRIKLLYGDQYGMSVARSDTNGTVIRLKLPMIMNEEGG